MKYMGSKARIKKDIVPIIQKYIDENNIKTYIEPFVGGANIINEIECDKKIGGDKSEPLIELLKHVRDGGELPLEISKALYDDVRLNKYTNKYEKWYVGAIGFLGSYNGRYFDGGYAKTTLTKDGIIRNYYDEARRNLLKQANSLNNIEFIHCDYSFFSNVKDSLIYCDIPYKNTKQYGVSKDFDYDKFWHWVKEMKTNNIVIVSEENAPKEFNCIWEKEIIRTQDNAKRKSSTEKLFVY